MSSGDYRTPPPFSRGDDYDKWKKKLKIWQTLTNLSGKRQGAAVFLALDDEAQSAVLEMPDGDIAKDNGLDLVVAKLNTLYETDRTPSAFQALEDFEAYKRPAALSIKELCNVFDLKYNKTKEYGTQLSTDVLAFRLMKSANLKEQEEQLIKATVGELTYDNMKTQLKRIHVDSSGAETAVKVKEDIEEQEILYGSGRYTNHNRRFAYRGRGRGVPISFKPRGAYGNQSHIKGASRLNPRDERGNISQCAVCKSIYHWAKECPHKDNVGSKANTNSINLQAHDDAEGDYNVTLFQSDFDHPNNMKSLLGEAFNCAVLDSGA